MVKSTVVKPLGVSHVCVLFHASMCCLSLAVKFSTVRLPCACVV
jgi:hypothetical protein